MLESLYVNPPADTYSLFTHNMYYVRRNGYTLFHRRED